MCVFNVCHRARMKIQPLLAKNCIPAPADQKIHHDQDPDGEMINPGVHESVCIIRRSQGRLQVDSAADQRAPANLAIIKKGE